MIILSIDPGIVNMGVAIYNSDSEEIIFAKKLSLGKRMRDVQEKNTINDIYKIFFDPSKSPIAEFIDRIQVILIEQQMKRRFLIIQHVIGAIAMMLNIKYYFVPPQVIKRHFGFGHKKGAKKSSSSSVSTSKGKTKKGMHRANKKNAIDIVDRILPEILQKNNKTLKTATRSITIKDDDIADAFLQALWFSQTNRI